MNYDAIVTTRPNLAICIKTADCVPVFIVDRIKKIIAVVHAGWRGTALEITTKVVRLLHEKYGSSPRDILAAIGPAIGQCCFEVDAASGRTLFLNKKTMRHFYSPAPDRINGCWIWPKRTARQF